jgi:hypothetical protein
MEGDLTPFCGLEVQKPTQALKSVKGQGILISHEQYIKDGKVLAHLRFQSKEFPGPLTDLSAWVGFCTSSPQQGVKYQL